MVAKNVVVGASAGGVEALKQLASEMPADFPAAVLVVLHVPPTGTSVLPQILDRAGPLPARHAQLGDSLEPGQILIAPPDQHLIVYDHAVTLSRGPKENGHRPAVDVLFRTAAQTLGPRVIGVVLSGSLDDGAAGMVAVRLRGGRGLVQDPEEALHASMPLSAMRTSDVQESLPVAKIPRRLMELLDAIDDEPAGQPSDLMTMETAMARADQDAMNSAERPGEPSGFGCPDCGGALFEITEGGLSRYRCRVGHAWSPDSLQAEQSVALESALWMALRALEEKAAFTDGASERARDRGQRLTGERFAAQAADSRQAATLVRDLIASLGDSTPYDALESDTLN